MKGKYHILEEYYSRITEILKDRLPEIPVMQLTYAKTYYGSYWKKDNVSSISLSVLRCWPVDHNELVDTISHELSHVIFPTHSKLHTAATKHFVNIVNQNFERLQGG